MDSGGDGGAKFGKGPKVRTCYICGRGYGLSSYEIHLKQCKELWVAREEQKDPKERKPLPEDPMEQARANGGGDTMSEAELEKINQIAQEAYNDKSLSTCAFCGRTFLPEKLAIHNKSCTKDNPAKRLQRAPKGESAPPAPAPAPAAASSRAKSTAASSRGSRTTEAGMDPDMGAGVGATGRPGSNASTSSSVSKADSPMAGAPARDMRRAKSVKGTSPARSGGRGKGGSGGLEGLYDRLDNLEGRAITALQSFQDIVQEIADIKNEISEYQLGAEE
jgi:hypothetical protein